MPSLLRLATPALFLSTVLTACGQPASAHDVLTRAASSTAGVKSATLDLRITMSAKSGNPVGFELRGPFQAGSGSLPVTRLSLTQIAGSKTQTFTLLSTGQAGFIGVDGKYYRLPDAQLQSLRAAQQGASGGFGELRVDRWARQPRREADSSQNGVATDRVTGSVDVVAFFNDVSRLMQAFGVGHTGSLPALNGNAAVQLQRATKASRFDLQAGKDDHVIRALAVSIDLAANAGERMQQGLGALGESHFRFDFSLSDPGKPVTVSPPGNPLPASQLGGA